MNTTLKSGDLVADGKYVIDSELGEGGLAVVYKVRHATLDTPFAVKILKVTLPSLQERLITEGQLQAQLQHPNVVKVTDVIKIDGFPALVMEFIDGIALDDYLNESAPTPKEAEEMFLQILDAVEEAHDRGIIHRDLKPANVMMQRTKTKLIPKVCDFGLGKNLAKEGQTRTGQQMGTPAYMAPEQIRSTKDVDQRADVFSLGAILYELLTGHRAFKGANTLDLLNAVASQPHATPRLYVQDLEERYVQAIDGALTKNAQFRIPDCGTFRQVLLGEEPWTVDRPSAPTDQGGDTLMSLGLDLMSDEPADTGMGLMNEPHNPNGPGPKLSSLVSERRVHHAPNSPNTTVVQTPQQQGNPNSQTTSSSTVLSDTPPPVESAKKSAISNGIVVGALVLFSFVGGILFMNGTSTDTNSTKNTDEKPAITQTATKTGTPPQVPTQNTKKEDLELQTEKPTEPAKTVTPTTSTQSKKTAAPKTTKSTTKPVSKKEPVKATSKPTPSKKIVAAKTEKPVTAVPVEKPTVPVATAESPSGATGTVKFSSATGLDKAYLQSSDGKQYTSTVPVGTYTIKLVCDGKTTTAGTKKIQEGKTLTLTCDCMFKKCK